MLVFVENTLQETEIPEIWETDEDGTRSVLDLKKFYFSWALNWFRGKNFRNKSINQDISITRDGLSEWKTKTKSRDQAISIQKLDVFLENGQFLKEEPDKNSDPNVEKVIYLQQPCKINDHNYCAVLTIKVYKRDNYHKYYHHYLDDIVLDPEK
jgi:hypothetical protein